LEGARFMKKKIFSIIFITFCFTAAVVGADENWRLFDSVDDLVGRWEGKMTMDIQENLNEMIPKSSMDIIAVFEYSKNTRTQNNDYTFFMNIDFGKFLDDMLKFPEFKNFGVSKDTVWDVLALIFSSMDELSEYNITVKKYYFEFSYNGKIDELINDDSQGQIFLNRDKTQMKWSLGPDVSFNLAGDGSTDLILYKTGR
jgi:hypothetical protein